jgi:hypothetical protein
MRGRKKAQTTEPKAIRAVTKKLVRYEQLTSKR